MSAPASYINPTVNVKQQPNQAYVALQAFNTQLSNYTTSLNSQFQTVGTFSAVTAATAANCPAGRVVYATGKVLVPGANPSVTTPMVKILDPDSGLNGFVTLNPAYFAPYSQVLSVQNTTSDSNGTLVLTTNLGGAGSNLSVGGSLTVDNGLTVTAGQVRAENDTALTAVTATASRTIDPTLGQVFTINLQFTAATQTLTLTTAASPAVGSLVYVVITANASHTTAGTVVAGANVKMPTITIAATASKVYTVSFVSDGTNLNCIGTAGGAITTGGM